MFSFLKKPLVRRWTVALLALSWNAMTYFLIMEQMDPIAAQTLTEEYQHFIEIRPVWELAAANLTYLAGFLGIVILLVGRKEAAWAFGFSAIAAAITVIPTFVLGPVIIGFWMLMATVFAALFAWFAHRTLG